MLKHKKLLSALLAAVMLFTVTGCGGTDDEAEDAGATSWEETANITATDETDEELYEQAIAEGGEVTLYSISSRCTKVAEAFMDKYPEITCTPFDISTNDLLDKVTREHEAGQYVADVVHIKDEDGSLYNEYVQNKIFYIYQPADILAHIDPSLTETQTPLYIELTQLFYNAEAYPDGSPVTNIWQVTEPQWKGKILMQDPLNNVGWGSWITGFCVGDTPDQLAAAYEELYGEELVLSEGCANAGYEFLKRLRENEPIFTSASDEVAEAVGTPGQSDPPIGFCASSKLRKNEDNGWVLAPVNLYPTTGIPAINTLYVVEGCEHPAAAKLLIRFMMGGIDGDTSGYEPFNTLGGWPVRDDIEPAEGSVPYEEITLSTIAGKLSWTRANLYKYVTTKEEIYLEICSDKMQSYFDDLFAAFPNEKPFTPDQWAAAWADVLNAHRDYLRYSDILCTIIEVHVTACRLASFKTSYHARRDAFVRLMEVRLGLSSHDASEVFLSVLYHAAGLCGSCHSNPVMLEAMKIAGIPYKKRDFRLNMYEFIRMNLWYYLSGPAGDNSCVIP